MKPNPAFIKTVADERRWSRSKKIVTEEYGSPEQLGPRYWVLVNSIYHRMKRNPSELRRGTEHELEHTSDPRVARAIAADHLKEHPDYYSRLDRCFAQKNLETMPVSPKVARQHHEFHKHPPDRIVELRSVWIPGDMVLIGHGVDVGYGVVDRQSEKSGHYVHDFGSSVKVYRRATQGERPTKTWTSFPTEVMVLGAVLGFSYEDKSDGEIYEIKGSKARRLAVTPNKRTLVVIGKGGVEFVLEGGKMHVNDWIRD